MAFLRKNALHARNSSAPLSNISSPEIQPLENPNVKSAAPNLSTLCPLRSEDDFLAAKDPNCPSFCALHTDFFIRLHAKSLFRRKFMCFLWPESKMLFLFVVWRFSGWGKQPLRFLVGKPWDGWDGRPPPWPSKVSSLGFCTVRSVFVCCRTGQRWLGLMPRQQSVTSGRLTEGMSLLLPHLLSLLYIYLYPSPGFWVSHTFPLSLYIQICSLTNLPLVFSVLMASPSKSKGNKPMGDDPIAPPANHSRKGQQPNFSAEPQSMADPMAANTGEGSKAKKNRKSKPPKVDLEQLKAIQNNITENIQALNTTSLFATIIGDPVEAKEVRKRIRSEWRFLAGGFQLVPVANKWFELRFDQPGDRDKAWERRPFHIAGQLLLIRPWNISFDPWTESLSKLDLWVRIPGLPTKYVSDSVLRSLIDGNKIGKVIRVAAFSAKGARLRYPRICVSADLTFIREKKVSLLNELGELETYPLWFEDFPEGCGSCGSEDHLFDDCPLRKICNAPTDGVMGGAPSEHTVVDEEPLPAEGGEWVRVAAKAPQRRAPPSFGHSKAELWKAFGKNVSISSDSSSLLTSSTSAEGSTTLSGAVVPVAEPVLSPLVAPPTSNYPNDAPPQEEPTRKNADNLVSELYLSDEDELMDFEEEIGFEDGQGGFPADMTQEEFEVLLDNIPASAEVDISSLGNPTKTATAARPLPAAPYVSPRVEHRFEQLRVEGSPRSESGKRKLGEEEGESASSNLMGVGSKRGRND